MTRQEEIRGGVESILGRIVLADKVLQYLHSKGVLLLVDRVQKYSEQTGASIEPIKYKILESLIKE